MNIFLFAWNFPQIYQKSVVGALRKMPSIFPQLDPKTLWSGSSADNQIFLAAMQMPNNIVQPRKYLHSHGPVAVTYSGLPINIHDTFRAHRADDLNSHWHELPEGVEGQFVFIRCDLNACNAEIITDSFGIEPVFFLRYQKAWIVSNSVWLILQSLKLRPELDPLGISLLLAFGRHCRNRTLMSDIELIPPASVWKWASGISDPRQIEHYPGRVLAQLTNSRKKYDARALAEQMTHPLRLLARHFGPPEIQITGGIDSRLVVALSMHDRLPVRYSTFRHVSAVDNHIACRIADRFALDHQSVSLQPQEVFDTWERAWWYLLRQNDGFVGFLGIPFPDSAKLMEPSRELGIRVWGSGGGIAKSYNPDLFKSPRPDAKDAYDALKKGYVKFDGPELMSQGCLELVEDYLNCFVKNCLNKDIQPASIPDFFFLYSYLGRWGGLIARMALPVCHLYSPFATKVFVETAMSLPTELRTKNHLHYNLIKFCEPRLHSIEYDKPLKFRNIGLNPWRRRIKKYCGIKLWRSLKCEITELRPVDYLEIKCEQLRDLCLSTENDVLWQLVDRSVFEEITGKKTPPKDRVRYLPILNNLSMICGYNDLLKQESEKWN
jgi:hypothetical protein